MEGFPANPDAYCNRGGVGIQRGGRHALWKSQINSNGPNSKVQAGWLWERARGFRGKVISRRLFPPPARTKAFPRDGENIPPSSGGLSLGSLGFERREPLWRMRVWLPPSPFGLRRTGRRDKRAPLRVSAPSPLRRRLIPPSRPAGPAPTTRRSGRRGWPAKPYPVPGTTGPCRKPGSSPR